MRGEELGSGAKVRCAKDLNRIMTEDSTNFPEIVLDLTISKVLEKVWPFILCGTDLVVNSDG